MQMDVDRHTVLLQPQKHINWLMLPMSFPHLRQCHAMLQMLVADCVRCVGGQGKPALQCEGGLLSNELTATNCVACQAGKGKHKHTLHEDLPPEHRPNVPWEIPKDSDCYIACLCTHLISGWSR